MSFDGTYDVIIDTPMGKQEGRLTLSREGTALSGTMAQGGDSAPIENARIDGAEARWDVEMTEPVPLTLSFTAEESPSGLAGTVALGPLGNAPFQAIRR